MIKKVIFLDDKDTWSISEGEENRETWVRFLRNIEKFITDLSKQNNPIRAYSEIKLCSYFQVQNEEQWESKLKIYESINENPQELEIDFNENRTQRLIGWLEEELDLQNETNTLVFCDFVWNCFFGEPEADIRTQLWNVLKEKNNCILFYYTQVEVEGALNFIKSKKSEHDILCKLSNRVWAVPKNPIGDKNDFVVAMANLYTTLCESEISF